MTNFRLPGPTPLPPSVSDAMQRPMINHHSAEFENLIADLRELLPELHQTSGDVLVMAGSGTSSLEAGITNVFSAGDRVLSINCGWFGTWFSMVAQAYGLDIVELSSPWGDTVDPEDVRDALRNDPGIRGVLITHNETSTGVTCNLEAVGAITREHDVLLLCDAVSSVGALPLKMDDWGVDLVLSGSQKAWMCPPGLAIVAIGERAWKAHEHSKMPRFAYDFTANLEAWNDALVHCTPPLSLLYALQAAAHLIDDEGLERVWERHARIGRFTRERIREMGLSILPSERNASDTVTTVNLPRGVEPKRILEILRDEFDTLFQSSIGPLASSTIRIGHMGWVSLEEMDSALTALSSALRQSEVAR